MPSIAANKVSTPSTKNTKTNAKDYTVNEKEVELSEKLAMNTEQFNTTGKIQDMAELLATLDEVLTFFCFDDEELRDLRNSARARRAMAYDYDASPKE